MQDSASTTAGIAAAPADRADEFLGHPRGLFVCFTTEMWERFSFYGMKYLLVLYLTKYHLFTDKDGLLVLGAYAGLVYALPVVGGFLADRFLGFRKAVLFGGVMLSVGHLLMAFEGHQAMFYAAGTVLGDSLRLADGTVLAAGTVLAEDVTMRDTAALNVFYLALAFIIVGVAFLKPNISTIVGALYGKDDPRRDSGFTIFYMGINVGSLAATLIAAWLGETYGWKYGFGAAGLGMIAGLVSFMMGQRHLHGHAEPADPAWLRTPVIGPLNREWLVYLGAIASLAAIWFLVQHEHVVHLSQNGLLIAAGAGLIAYAFFKGTREDFHRMLVLCVLIASTIVFWALFEQSAGSMTLYADRVVDRQIGGFEPTAAQFGAFNPLFIILLAPVFAWLWVWLAQRNLEPSTPVKFSLGIMQAGLGFGMLVLGSQMPDQSGKVAMIWLVLAYLLHTSGELCLSPVGLSAVTKLSIGSVVGASMGTWFLATGLAETVAARFSALAAVDTTAGEVGDLGTALATYTQLFEFLLWLGLGTGVVLLILSPILRRGMHGVH